MSPYCVTSARHSFFFFNDTATTEIYTLSLHDALPISRNTGYTRPDRGRDARARSQRAWRGSVFRRRGGAGWKRVGAERDRSGGPGAALAGTAGRCKEALDKALGSVVREPRLV